ncbi:unnamed protein product, partial [Staurois parvus]
WAQVGALLGTGGRTAGHRWAHCWAQVGALLGIGGGALLGTGGRTAGHRWVHCWAQVGALLGIGGCIAGHKWAELSFSSSLPPGVPTEMALRAIGSPSLS